MNDSEIAEKNGIDNDPCREIDGKVMELQKPFNLLLCSFRL